LRSDYANTYFNALGKAGLLGEGDTTPLEKLGNYTEYYPWEGVPDEAQALKLKNDETVYNINGMFVPAENGAYMVDANYYIPSLFSVEDWYDNLKGKIDSGLANNGFSAAGSELAVDGKKITVSTNSTASESHTMLSAGGGDNSYYTFSCEPGTAYTIHYTVRVSGAGKAQLTINGYGENCAGAVESLIDDKVTEGTYSKPFTTGAGTKCLGFSCGTYGSGETTAEFVDITIFKDDSRYAGAVYVQEATQFYYGDAGANQNLFSLDDFYYGFTGNSTLYNPYATDGTINNINYDGVGTLKIDAQLSMPFKNEDNQALWNFDSAVEKGSYIVPVNPGGEYTFKFDAKLTPKSNGQYTQAQVWVIGLSEDGGNQHLVNAYPDSDSGAATTDTYTFTLNPDAAIGIKYLVFLFGVKNENTIAEFSNITLTNNYETNDTSGDYYYYDVVFTPTAINDFEDGQVVYVEITNSNIEPGETLGKMKIQGIKEEGNTGDFPAGLTFYAAEINPAPESGPQIYFDAEHEYRTPRNSAYRPAADGETPYFVGNTGTGLYVGEGYGYYNVEPSDESLINIVTDTVFYTGGFSNNNWFKKHVLNCNEDDTFSVSVNTVTPEELGSNDLLGSIEFYDLVVFTAGTGYEGSSSDGSSSDLPDSFMAKYGENADRPYYTFKTPTVYDKALFDSAGANSNLYKFLTYLKKSSGQESNDSTGWVNDFIYCFSFDDISGTSSDSRSYYKYILSFDKLMDELAASETQTQIYVRDGHNYEPFGTFNKTQDNSEWWINDLNGNRIDNIDLARDYYYKVTVSNSSLANPWFDINIKTTMYDQDNDPYRCVIKEINEENMVRDQQYNIEESEYYHLTPVVTEGNSIRYILNFAGQRIITDKDIIRILDIEPYTSGKVFQYVDGNPVLKSISEMGYRYNFTHKQEQGGTVSDKVKKSRQILTKDQVVGTLDSNGNKVPGWFPASSVEVIDGKVELVYGFDESGKPIPAKVEIVTMATNQVIAHTDDICETYDMVYIGDSSYNMKMADFNTATVQGYAPDYFDSLMDGMYYTSTGDLMTTNARNFWGEDTLGGFIGGEYYWSNDSGGLFDDLTLSDWAHLGDNLREIAFRIIFKGIGIFNQRSAFLKGWETFQQRSSGNDLTAVKEQQLETFMKAGLPVVIADELTTGYKVKYVGRCEFTSKFVYQKTRNDIWAIFLKKTPCYHIQLHAYFLGEFGGLPVEFVPQNCIDVEWYHNDIPIPNAVTKYKPFHSTLQNEDMWAFTFEPGNVYIPDDNDGKYCVSVDDADDYCGEYYAILTIKNTGTDMDGDSVKTDKIVVSKGSIDAWAQCEIISASEYTTTAYDVDGTAYTVTGFREKRPSNLPANYEDTFDFYFTDNSSGNAEYFTVKYYKDSNCSVDKRIVVPVSNTWYYQTGTAYKKALSLFDWITAYWCFTSHEIGSANANDHYKNLEFIKKGTGDGQLAPGKNGALYVNGRGFDRIKYEKSTGGMSENIDVGTPAYDYDNDVGGQVGLGEKGKTHKLENVKVLDVTRLEVADGFGTPYPETGFYTKNAALKESAVDNSSYMYVFLSKAFDKTNGKYGKNVFAEREIEKYRDVLKSYVNFTSPKIIVDESSIKSYLDYPRAGSTITDGKFEVKFTINNPTDPDSGHERFKLNFYVDINNDGKYKIDERTQLTVEESSDGGTSWRTVDENDTDRKMAFLRSTTKQNTFLYHAYLNLPSDYTGILPWKLEIVKLDGTDGNGHWSVDGNDNIESNVNYANLHDSYVNYAYVKPPQATRIKVLQILPSNWPMTYTLREDGNSQSGNVGIGSIFESPEFIKLLNDNESVDSKKNWVLEKHTGVPNLIWQRESKTTSDTIYMAFGPEADMKTGYLSYIEAYINSSNNIEDRRMPETFGGSVPDFLVELHCTNVKTLNDLYGNETDDDGYQIRGSNPLLDKYDMLVLGFADNWGKSGQVNMSVLTTNIGMKMGTAFAIQDFISRGNAVLLTHDTTTTYNNFPNNAILRKGIEWAKSLGDFITGIADLFTGDDDENEDEELFEDGEASSEDDLGLLDKLKLLIKNLEKDERSRNGYWMNLLRDVCGLDRYGVTYSIKTKARTDYDAWECTNKSCGYTVYKDPGLVFICPKCGNRSYNKVTKNELTDYTLFDGYSYDMLHGHRYSIYTDNDTEFQEISKANMLAKDYSISYVPGSSRTQTDRFVGGYTRYELARLSQQDDDHPLPTIAMYNSDDAIFDTTYVTQTNKGKLTTYPYDINFYEMDGNDFVVDENGGKEIDEFKVHEISLTHDQVYQLNMNGDDVTCWYCMSGENFADIPNDALNAYYIYSRRNITYTGAGHTNTFDEWEAKLFANTLIAAYRPKTGIASVEFIDPDSEYNGDYRSTDYVLLTRREEVTTDNNGVDSTGVTIDEEQVHFHLDNKNLANDNGDSDQKIDIKVEYQIDGGAKINVEHPGNLYYGDDVKSSADFSEASFDDAENNASTGWVGLTKSTNYTFVIPAEVRAALQSGNAKEVVIYITPVTRVPENAPDDEKDVNGRSDNIRVRILGLSVLS
ncbi:MAG: DUF5057 domain-containing protein, partial [Clostridia bacterium]|nr:DUF5057 domain-containing protein [Clostridia bacterium]